MNGVKMNFARIVPTKALINEMRNDTKKIKELDDNSPKKTDSKDPKTIAKLVVDGRYSIPYMPEGIYAEIRDLVYSREPIWII